MPLMPRPAARAIGTFANTPIAIVSSPARSAVPAAAAAGGTPAADRMLGFTKMM
jgi:hypothetical protein